ncbi:MAG: hypothetical protein WDZ82_03010 [Candidatus Paceibacterota bacterium]
MISHARSFLAQSFTGGEGFLSSVDISTGAILFLIVAVLVLAFLVFRSERHMRKLSAPVYDAIISQAQDRAQKIVDDATESARAIQADAEKNATAYLTDQQSRAEDVNRQYTQQLQAAAEEAQHAITDYRKTATDATDAVVEHLREKISSSVDHATKYIEKAVDQVDASLVEQTNSLSDSLDSVKEGYIKELRSVLSEELSKANSAIDAYRSERMNMVDHEIGSLVEKTTQLTLQRTLTTDEHTELVQEALEEARRQGVFTGGQSDS